MSVVGLTGPLRSFVSYCFFKVSTDFFSNSSRAATNFFTLASKSSAPLEVKGVKGVSCIRIKLLVSFL